MESLFIIIVSLCLCFVLKTIFSSVRSRSRSSLPPGPPHFPIIGSFFLQAKSFFDLEPLLRNLHAKLGPIVTLHIGSRPSIFVVDRSLTHRALVQNGAVFSNRPTPLPTREIIDSNQRDISSAFYGSRWRILRRNLTSEILHSSRVKSFSGIRKWVLETLIDRIRSDSENSNAPIKVIDHIQYAMFCLLVFMCFGDKLNEKQVKDVEFVQRRLLLNFNRFNILNYWPRLTQILLRNRWEELFRLRKEQGDVLISLIRARKKVKEERLSKSQEDKVNIDESNNNIVAYVDTLLDLELPEEKRKLNESELVSVSSEFLIAGTDTTATALQWIMANLVKYSHIQERLVKEISEVMGDREEDKEVKEEDLNKMPYLKAVVLEGLRRHPPGHFLVPHAVSEDNVELGGYLVPNNATINFMVAEIGWDPKVWENPMEFKPERFLMKSENNNGGGEEEAVEFDIRGNKEIKMMPFGAGRRMCPGYNLAMLHLEYFVANLVWNFEWKAANCGVDLTEKQEFTVVMKNPLQVHVYPRH